MSQQIVMWVGFNLFALAMLALDLGVLHRKAHVVTAREALVWSAVWIALALLFDVGVYFWYGPEPALDFLAGYLIEKSLSVDNIFVFWLIFSAFHVPSQYQHTVLFWGIVGALLMRALCIAIGITLLQTFHWVVYIFGAFLLLTGVKMAIQQPKHEIDPGRQLVLRLLRRFLPITERYEDGKFFVRRGGRVIDFTSSITGWLQFWSLWGSRCCLSMSTRFRSVLP